MGVLYATFSAHIPRIHDFDAGARTIVFIDAADDRTYTLNTTEEATFHVGHRVRIVAHVIPESTNTLFVHSFTCLRAKAGRMPA